MPNGRKPRSGSAAGGFFILKLTAPEMPPKANGKAATKIANGNEAEPIDVDELDTAAGPDGIAAFELPKSKGRLIRQR